MELSCSALVDSRQTTGPECARGLTFDTSLASTISASWAFGSMSSPGIEELQELHYDRISPQYELHYGDPCSQEYRDRFINQPMFAGIDLHGLDVLEAMCGNGQTTEFLLSRGARVTGLDISTAEIDSIDSFQQRWPGSDATCGSMLSSGFAGDSFDCVAVVGGLHHFHPHLSDALREIHRILKPGGRFCFAEPHQGSLPDRVRSFSRRLVRIERGLD